MHRLLQQMREDKQLRDYARALVDQDVENVRDDVSVKSLANRALDRLTEGASGVYDDATEAAADNKGALSGVLAAIIGGAVLWFARAPLGELLFGEENTPDDIVREGDEAGSVTDHTTTDTSDSNQE